MALFHKGYREFISNHTSESASTYMFLSFGSRIITQSFLIKEIFPFNFYTIIARGFASLYLPQREENSTKILVSTVVLLPFKQPSAGQSEALIYSQSREQSSTKCPSQQVRKARPRGRGPASCSSSLSTLLLPSPLIPPRHLVISPHAVNNGLQILTKAMAEMIIHPSKRLL